MKHKYTALLLALLLPTLSLTGCGGEPAEKSPYKNGTYTAAWADPEADGFMEELTISIKNGVITVLTFDGNNATGGKKSEDGALREEMEAAVKTSGGVNTYPKKFYADIIDSFNRAGGKVEEMENVAGATRSTRSFRTLLTNLLAENALTGEAKTLSLPRYQDGSYTVTQPAFDENGYKEFLTLTVSSGKVTIENYDAKDKDGKLRSTDTETKFPVAPQTLSEQLRGAYGEKKGDLSAIETVAGATRSSDSFKALTARALDNAHFRGPGEDSLPTLKNGLYRAEMSDYQNGWKDYLVLAVCDDVVTVAEYGSRSQSGGEKRQDEGLKKQMMEGNKKNSLPQTYPEQYEKDIIAAFKAANGSVEGMENVAGATASCNNFKLMAGVLTGYNIKEGKTQTSVVEPLGAETPDTPAPESSSSSKAQ